MILFQLYRRMPWVRRAFHQRDQARRHEELAATLERVAAELDCVKAERDQIIDRLESAIAERDRALHALDRTIPFKRYLGGFSEPAPMCRPWLERIKTSASVPLGPSGSRFLPFSSHRESRWLTWQGVYPGGRNLSRQRRAETARALAAN